MQKTLTVTPLQQKTARTCVHTCLAMITGEDVDGLINRFGDHGIGFDEQATVMVEHGIFPVETTRDQHPFFNEGVYLVATASLNLPGELHLVVVEVIDGLYHVHDPNKGRDGKAWYEDQDVVSCRLNRCEVYYCDTKILRKMGHYPPEDPRSQYYDKK